jgi:hypothetical protein
MLQDLPLECWQKFMSYSEQDQKMPDKKGVELSIIHSLEQEQAKDTLKELFGKWRSIIMRRDIKSKCFYNLNTKFKYYYKIKRLSDLKKLARLHLQHKWFTSIHFTSLSVKWKNKSANRQAQITFGVMRKRYKRIEVLHNMAAKFRKANIFKKLVKLHVKRKLILQRKYFEILIRSSIFRLNFHLLVSSSSDRVLRSCFDKWVSQKKIIDGTDMLIKRAEKYRRNGLIGSAWRIMSNQMISRKNNRIQNALMTEFYHNVLLKKAVYAMKQFANRSINVRNKSMTISTMIKSRFFHRWQTKITTLRRKESHLHGIWAQIHLNQLVLAMNQWNKIFERKKLARVRNDFLMKKWMKYSKARMFYKWCLHVKNAQRNRKQLKLIADFKYQSSKRFFRYWRILQHHYAWQRKNIEIARSFSQKHSLKSFFYIWHSSRDWNSMYERKVAMPMSVYAVNLARKVLKGWKIHVDEQKQLYNLLESTKSIRSQAIVRHVIRILYENLSSEDFNSSLAWKCCEHWMKNAHIGKYSEKSILSLPRMPKFYYDALTDQIQSVEQNNKYQRLFGYFNFGQQINTEESISEKYYPEIPSVLPDSEIDADHGKIIELPPGKIGSDNCSESSDDTVQSDTMVQFQLHDILTGIWELYLEYQQNKQELQSIQTELTSGRNTIKFAESLQKMQELGLSIATFETEKNKLEAIVKELIVLAEP